jgi:ABC-2 type transport system permease protein
MNTLRRYVSLWVALGRISLVQEMMFKLNFILWIVVEALWFALQLAFMGVLYSHTDSIGGWTKWEVILLSGCSQFLMQLVSIFFMTNLTNLSELIRTGKLDFFLLLPVNARFLISTRKFEVGNCINALLGLAVIVWALVELHYRPTFAQILGFILLCGVGLLIHYSWMCLLASTAFWTVRSQGIVWGYYNLFNIARLPDVAFPPGVFKAVFTFVLPMLLVSNVPSKLLVGRLQSPWEIGLLLSLGLLSFGLSEWVWRRALKQYTSASS